MTRLRHWIDATHGARLELVRHFLADFFVSDLVTSADQWRRMAIGVVSVLISAGILMVPTFDHRYGCVDAGAPSRFCPPIADYREAYLNLVQADTTWLIGLAFCFTGLLTAIQWQSLFPSLRDRLALASLPVSPLDIFWSKLTAVVAGFAALVVAMNSVPAVLLPWIASGRWQPHSIGVQAIATFAAMSAACVFMFFGTLALQGLLLNLLPPRLFERVSVYAQAALFTANVAALPFLWRQPSPAWWPPSWFAGLGAAMLGRPNPQAHYALYAVGLSPLLAILTYLVSYHRYQRLLIEAPGAKARNPQRWPAWLTLRDPHEQAVFAFIWKTLTRSRLHRLMLQAAAGLAIAWIVGAGDLGSHDSFPVVLIPLAVSVFLIAGLRYLFSIPSELRANWLFQIAESEGRIAWLRAVDRFTVGCALAPVYASSLPAAIAVFGWWQATRVTLLGFFLALVVFEFLFREWHKAPFTCSYLPGKRQLWQMLLWAFAALSYLGTATALVYAFSTGWVTFAAAFPLLWGAWNWLHKQRTESWTDRPLVYDDLPEPAVASLHIDFERGSLESPQPSAEVRVPHRSFWDAEEDSRDAAPFFHPAGLLDDLRYGLRLLRRNFALAATIVATLTIGIGMNVSVFTLLNAVAFRPHVPDPGTFVRVSPVHTGDGLSPVGGVTSDEYLVYRDRVRSLSSLAASFRSTVTLENDRSTAARALLVSCNFFAVYGAGSPRAGRFFRPDECATVGQAPVAVIAEELWRDRFGGDKQIVGRRISVDDQTFTVVGVAQAGSAARANGTEIWMPYTAQPLLDLGFNPKISWLWLDGRLAPGISRSAAEAELTVLSRQLDNQNPGRETTLYVTDGSFLALQPIMNRTGGYGFSRYWAMMFIMLALGMVLCVTCANVMTLLLSRAVGRRREIAVRLSLGAPRSRLLRMLLAEGFLLAVAAGMASLYISYRVPGILYQFISHEPADFPLDPDWRIFAYVFGVALAAGGISALAPALESLKVDLTASLKGGGASIGNDSGSHLRSLLVSLQVALSLALLVGGGMFVQEYWRMAHANSGYETRQVLVAPLRYPAGYHLDRADTLVRDVLARIEGLPGASSAARSNVVPFAGNQIASARFIGRRYQPTHEINVQPGAPDLLRTLGIRLLRGRDFRESDLPSNNETARAIVSEKFVREMSPETDPIGRVMELVGGPSYEIIGVAKDVETPMTSAPIVYLFNEWDRRQAYLVMRFSGNTRAAQDAVRTAVRSVRSDLLVMPQTLQARIDDALTETWRVVILILTLGLVAMTLSVAGIYGVISFTVTQQTREIGIRLALGAQKTDIFREVLVSGGRPVLLGLFIGLWIALAGDSAIRSIFANAPVQLDTANPAVFLSSALLLALAGLVAMFFPARRGARSDPMKALHYE
jgi:predicted permease